MEQRRVGESSTLITHTFVKRPLVTEWTDELLRAGPVFGPKELGYRLLRRNSTRRTETWVRPWALWKALKAYDAARLLSWRTLWWLEDRGVFHIVSPDGMILRWRGVRPGPRGLTKKALRWGRGLLSRRR